MRSKACSVAITVAVFMASVLTFGLDPASADPIDYVTEQYTPTVTSNVLYQASGPYDETDMRNWALFDDLNDASTPALASHASNTGTHPWRVDVGGSVSIGTPSGASSKAAMPQGSSRSTATAFTPLPTYAPLDLFTTVRSSADGARVLFRAQRDTGSDTLFDHLYVELSPSADTMTLHKVDAVESPPGTWTSTDVVVGSPVGVTLGSGAELVHVVSKVKAGSTSLSEVTVTINGTNLTADLPIWWTGYASVGFSGTDAHAFDDVKLWHPLSFDAYEPNITGDRAGMVVIHGGSFSGGDKADVGKTGLSSATIVGLSNEFANRGFQTFSINYRTHLSGAYAAITDANTDSITTASGSWDLTVGANTLTGLSPSISNASLQSQLNGLASVSAAGGVTVWGGPLPTRVFLAWGATPPATVTATGATVPARTNVLRQLELTPACTTIVNATLDAIVTPEINLPYTGDVCTFAALVELYKCAGLGGGEFPPAGGACDAGFVRFAGEAVQAAYFDAQSAVRFLKANAETYDLDASKLFVTGESAGGITALNIAAQPEEGTGQPNDVGDAVVAGALPYSGGWMPNGTANLAARSTPVAVFQFDRDTVSFWPGVLPMTIQSQQVDLLADHAVDYNGFCGSGHQMPTTTTTWDAMITQMMAFVHPLVVTSGSPYAVRHGIWTGTTSINSFGALDPNDMVDRSDSAFTPLVGDFNGDGEDDLYWYSTGTAAACSGYWMGKGNGTFLPAPTFNSTLSNPTSAQSSIPTPPAGTKAYVGNFDADASTDIFWYGVTDPAPPATPVVTAVMWWGGATTEFGTTPRVFTAQTISMGHFSQVVVGNFGKGHNISGRADGDDLYLLDLHVTGTFSDWDQTWYGNAGTNVRDFKSVGMYTGMQPGSDGSYVTQPLVGNFDGDSTGSNDDQYDDIYWYGRGSLVDSVWYGAENASATTGAAFDEHNFTATTNWGQIIVGNFGKGSTSTDGDDLYFLDIQGGAYAGWDTLLYGSGAKTFETVSQYYGFTPTDVATAKAVVGNFDSNTDATSWTGGWDDIVWYGPEAGPDAKWYGTQNATPSAPSGFTKYTATIGDNYAPVTGDFNEDDRPDIFWHLASWAD